MVYPGSTEHFRGSNVSPTREPFSTIKPLARHCFAGTIKWWPEFLTEGLIKSSVNAALTSVSNVVADDAMVILARVAK